MYTDLQVTYAVSVLELLVYARKGAGYKDGYNEFCTMAGQVAKVAGLEPGKICEEFQQIILTGMLKNRAAE